MSDCLQHRWPFRQLFRCYGVLDFSHSGTLSLNLRVPKSSGFPHPSQEFAWKASDENNTGTLPYRMLVRWTSATRTPTGLCHYTLKSALPPAHQRPVARIARSQQKQNILQREQWCPKGHASYVPDLSLTVPSRFRARCCERTPVGQPLANKSHQELGHAILAIPLGDDCPSEAQDNPPIPLGGHNIWT